MDAPIDIVLLAAGVASRFGRIKQLEPIGGVPMVRRAAEAALATRSRVTVVVGAHAEAVTDALAGLPVALAGNSDWSDGMGGSIACGIRLILGLTPESTAAIICLADQPLVSSADLDHLITRHRDTPDRILAADHGDVTGPPALFPRACYPELTRLCGPRGARFVIERHRAIVDMVPMPSARIDVDTPADLFGIDIG